MEKRLISVDKDDVLNQFRVRFLQYINVMFETDVKFEDLYTYNFEEIWGLSVPEILDIIDVFYDAPEHNEIEPYPLAIDTLLSLQDHFTFVVLTSRPYYKHEVTNQWLETHFPTIFQDVHYANHFHDCHDKVSKGQMCCELGVFLHIDDAHFHVESVAPLVSHALLMDAPWNKDYQSDHDNVRRVHSWQDVHSILFSYVE